jgi:hypothetical protein
MTYSDELTALIAAEKSAAMALRTYGDGFQYLLTYSAYGHHRNDTAYNACIALRKASEYNGDNGYCDLHTDNPALENLDRDGLTVIFTPKEV